MISFSEILFPKLCFGCDSYGSYLCSDCIKKKTYVLWNQSCHVCGGKISLGFVHQECIDKSYLDGCFSMFVYDGVIKKLIQQVKYNYSYDVFNDLGSKMADFYALLPQFDRLIVVPVPLNKIKKNLRGFNQAKVLASQIAKKNNLELQDIIQRSRNTKTQVGMKKHEREVNLKEAFSIVVPKSKDPVQSNNVTFLLVDDVYTTGTTLNECAKMIKKLYPNSLVFGYTLAKAPGGSTS